MVVPFQQGGTMARHELTDEQWNVLKKCLPPLHNGRERKMYDRRTSINGIVWGLKTGAPWRNIPKQ
jgi:transposase